MSKKYAFFVIFWNLYIRVANVDFEVLIPLLFKWRAIVTKT